MRIAVPTFPGERRVALIPAQIAPLAKAGLDVAIESGAGVAAGFPNQAYREKGAAVIASRDELFAAAEAIIQVRGPGANPATGLAEVAALRPGQSSSAWATRSRRTRSPGRSRRRA